MKMQRTSLQRISLLLALILTGLIRPAISISQQGEIEPVRPGEIRIDSEPRHAQIFFRDSLLGTTPLFIPGTRGWDSLLAVYPSRSAWNATSQRVALPEPIAEKAILIIRLPVKFVVQSVPFGATVFDGDSIIGTTPCIYTLREGTSDLVLRKDRFEQATITIRRDDVTQPRVVLTPLPGVPGEPILSGVQSSIRIPAARVMLSGGLGLAAGIASVFLKSQANSLYDEYRRTPDPDLLGRTRKYDLYAGIALGVMEASFAYLVYLLLIE